MHLRFNSVNDNVDGLRVKHWDPSEAAALGAGVPPELLDEIESLRQEVAELAERVDFTERLLADPGRRRAPPAAS